MKTLLFYLLQVIVTTGILYGYYHFALRNKRFHRYNRYYLLAATILSITVPFLNIPVYFAQSATESSFVLETLTVISSAGTNNSIVFAQPDMQANWFTRENILLFFYMLVALIALLRIVFSVLKIRRIIQNNLVEQLDKIHFVNTDEPGTPFSFFRWLFWNKKIELQSEKGEQIFRHELFHIEQKHSWDTIYMELLTVVFWINPFFYLIRKEVKAIHEFLADQFAVTENTKWQYAELLLMQALNTNQHLVNPFFHNQIKRRIAMITISKKPSHQYLRKMMVLPVAAIAIGLFAFSYKEKNKPESNDSLFISDHPNIEDTAKNPSSHSITWVEDFPLPPKKSPTAEQLKTWADPKMYGIWLDEKRISNTDLTKYNSSDFVLYTVSKLEKNAVNYGMHYYQVGLLTSNYYEKSKKNATQNTGKFIVIKDTTKPLLGTRFQKSLIVIDGLIRDDLKANNINESLSSNDIESITVLKDKIAIEKYGAKGENGVIEIITKKTNKNEQKEITTDSKNSVGGDNIIFDKVEVVPQFPGGSLKWRQYLERNLDATAPIKKKAQDGTYTVVVQFIVDKEGNISDVKGLTNHEFGMEEEAIRVIKRGPQWIPAVQNGHPVSAYKRQAITFIIGKGGKNFPSNVSSNDSVYNEVIITTVGSSQDINNKSHYYGINTEHNNSLLVIDGKVIGRMKDNWENAGLVNSVHITVLDFKSSLKKYGEQAKYGAWEAYTLKSNSEDYSNDPNIRTPGVATIDRIFEKPQSPPSFPGGDTAWRRYLMKNCKASTPVDSGAPAGTYKVYVQFQVRVDGILEFIRTTTNYGYGMENEAMRLIKAGPPWIPAKQNGRNVRSYVLQPITFQVEEEQDPVTISNPVTKTSLNTFYIGVPNRLTIKVSNVKPENLLVKISTGSIKGDNGNYIAIVNSVGETSLEIYSNENGIKKKISQKTFKTHFIPDPRSENFKEVASSLGLKVNIINK